VTEVQPAARPAIRVFTIGFAKKGAREFFSALRAAGVRRVVDIRLNNVSQLAGFTKKSDLEYFLSAIGDIVYVHRPDLAPTKEILDAYKKKQIDWAEYERRFLELLRERCAESLVSPDEMDGACLLCSEPAPKTCHRRLVAEYLREKWGNVEVCHL
jgi:uncharacterized protein (DUF488 family)